MTESKGVSMLDKLAGQIVEEKAAKGAKLSPALTPVAGEVVASPIPNHPLGSLPDDPDIILARLATARAEVETVLESIIKLERMYGKPETIIEADAVLSEALIQKEKERRGDDAAKAREGDKKAAERVNAETPIAAVVEAEEARLRKRAAVVAAMAGETPGGPEETFPERFERLSEEAKAATYGTATESTTPAGFVGDSIKAALDDGWSCPEHGTDHIVVKTSPRRGVEFRKCVAEGCHNFEKV